MAGLRDSRGFTLMELLVSTLLSFMVFGALMAIFQPLMKTRMDSAHFASQQGGALFALRALRRDLIRASWIRRDGSTEELYGCVNYHPDKGAGLDGILERGRPVDSFFYCVRGGTLYRHEERSGGGCPPPPRCGVGEAVPLARGVSSEGGFFACRRPGYVTVNYVVGGRRSPYVVATTFAVGSGP